MAGTKNMQLTGSRRVMGQFTLHGWLKWLGRLGTGVMALAFVALFATLGRA